MGRKGMASLAGVAGVPLEGRRCSPFPELPLHPTSCPTRLSPPSCLPTPHPQPASASPPSCWHNSAWRTPSHCWQHSWASGAAMCPACLSAAPRCWDGCRRRRRCRRCRCAEGPGFFAAGLCVASCPLCVPAAPVQVACRCRPAGALPDQSDLLQEWLTSCAHNHFAGAVRRADGAWGCRAAQPRHPVDGC